MCWKSSDWYHRRPNAENLNGKVVRRVLKIFFFQVFAPAMLTMTITHGADQTIDFTSGNFFIFSFFPSIDAEILFKIWFCASAVKLGRFSLFFLLWRVQLTRRNGFDFFSFVSRSLVVGVTILLVAFTYLLAFDEYSVLMKRIKLNGFQSSVWNFIHRSAYSINLLTMDWSSITPSISSSAISSERLLGAR